MLHCFLIVIEIFWDYAVLSPGSGMPLRIQEAFVEVLFLGQSASSLASTHRNQSQSRCRRNPVRYRKFYIQMMLFHVVSKLHLETRGNLSIPLPSQYQLRGICFRHWCMGQLHTLTEPYLYTIWHLWMFSYIDGLILRTNHPFSFEIFEM